MNAPASLTSSSGTLQRTGTETHISASRLQCWFQCRLKYYFRYILALPSSPSPALHTGKAVHAVLQAWNLARWRKEPLAPDRLRAVFDQQWKQLQAGMVIDWKAEEGAERDSAWALLQAYFRDTPIPPNEQPEAVEVWVEADLPGLPKLVGLLDLVRSGGRIVDFKTTGKTPDQERAAHLHEIQLCCYAILYRESTSSRESGIELHQLVKLKNPKLVITLLDPMNDRQKNRLYRMIDSYVEGVGRKDFVPSPGFHCASCEFFPNAAYGAERRSRALRKPSGASTG
jgi:CRISPR/Cas system-associated exonuclease Cas4 (RecB family)